MSITNYGNGYKFKAIMDRRSNIEYVMIQATKKNGEWGKPCKYRTFGNETPEEVVERLTMLNAGKKFRIA